MDSLIFLAVILFLAGPILAIVALVQIGNLGARVRALSKDVERLSAGGVTAPAAAPEMVAPLATEETQVADYAAPTSKAWGSTAAGESVRADIWGDEPSDVETAASVASAPPDAEPPLPQQKPDVEGALASRWFVWVGGIAIALGGLLFVKYAHDQGLIPPALRVVIGLAVAAALVVAGEWVRKRGDALAQGYVPAALSAAGLVIAFGIIYAAYVLYDLLSPTVCFPLLVAVGLGALWLSAGRARSSPRSDWSGPTQRRPWCRRNIRVPWASSPISW